MFEVLYHLAKFGGARITPAAGVAKNVEFFLPRDAAMLDASPVLGVVILSVRRLSVRLSVRHTRALWLIQRTYRRYFCTT